jgi:hypothetical protein
MAEFLQNYYNFQSFLKSITKKKIIFFLYSFKDKKNYIILTHEI